MTGYQDILHLSRPFSRHPKMSVENRAKLFAPFAALRGFDIEILTMEQDWLLVPRVSLCQDQRELIRQELEALRPGDQVVVTYFVPVKEADGWDLGEYVTETGSVRKREDLTQRLLLERGPIDYRDLRELVKVQEKKEESA